MSILLMFLTISQQHHLPPHLLSSLCYIESKHDVAAIHHDDGGADSLGICQIKLQTAREMGYKGTKQQLMQPSTNIRYAAKYLRYQIRRYGSIERAVVAYNKGNARDLTTSRYQRKVFNKWMEAK
jgi:soluble lytic murein transglycosylase-like protein